MQNNPKVISLPFIHHGRVLENKHHPHLLLGYFSEVLQVHHKLVEKEGEDYGYAKFTDTIDTLIVGRRTYDYVLNEIGSSHYDNGQRDVYVITRTEKPQVGRTHFYTGDLSDLVNWIFRAKVHHYSAPICTTDSGAKYTSL